MPSSLPMALLALSAGALGIGTTEFVIMGLVIDHGPGLGTPPEGAAERA